ncbi:MAG: endonuclease III [Bacilli bacterium]
MPKNNNELIFSYLDKLFPDPKTELLYEKDYELLFAVVLSAQTTDKRVNIVTRVLFSTYKTLEEYANAPLEDIENIIRSIGLYKTKAKNIKEISEILLEKFDGKVPSSKSDLLLLPGVGVKTANVVRAELFKIPEIAVDTHVNRVSKRLGYADENDSVEEVERKLRAQIDESRYIKTHHQFIHFGRYFCKAQSPSCKTCELVAICKEKNKNL